MASKDLYNQTLSKVGLKSSTIASDTTTNGEWIDLAGNYSVIWSIISGTVTDGAYAVKLQDADESDKSDAADVDSDFILGSLTDASFASTDDDTVKSIGYNGKKRYVRLSLVSTSTATGGTFAAIAVLSDPRHAPSA